MAPAESTQSGKRDAAMLRSAMAGALISTLASGPVGAEPIADFYKSGNE
jgi:hypothetical protein